MLHGIVSRVLPNTAIAEKGDSTNKANVMKTHRFCSLSVSYIKTRPPKQHAAFLRLLKGQDEISSQVDSNFNKAHRILC